MRGPSTGSRVGLACSGPCSSNIRPWMTRYARVKSWQKHGDGDGALGLMPSSEPDNALCAPIPSQKVVRAQKPAPHKKCFEGHRQPRQTDRRDKGLGCDPPGDSAEGMEHLPNSHRRWLAPETHLPVRSRPAVASRPTRPGGLDDCVGCWADGREPAGSPAPTTTRGRGAASVGGPGGSCVARGLRPARNVELVLRTVSKDQCHPHGTPMGGRIRG